MAQIRDLLAREHVFVPLQGSTLREAMTHMVRCLAQRGVVNDTAALEEPFAREPVREVVALNDRVVLPHYRTAAVDTVILALSLYLQTLATLARVLRHDEVTERLTQQDSVDGVLALDVLTERKIQATLTVRDIMSRSVLCISQEPGLSEAATMMVNKDVGQPPVVSGGTRAEIIRKLFGP